MDLNIENYSNEEIFNVLNIDSDSLQKNDLSYEILYKKLQIKIDKLRNVDINEEVVVVRGPFYNQQGIVKSIKNNSVVVSLPSLGYSMIAEIPMSNIKILNPNYEIEPAQYHSLSVC